MSGDKGWFTNLEELSNQAVMLGNDLRLAVKGIGNVRTEVDGAVHLVTNVYYVPELKANLMSIGQIQEKGAKILLEDGSFKIYHPTKGCIIQVPMSANRLYMVKANKLPQESACFKTTSEDKTHLWHCRYGHLSYKGLMTLQRENLVSGLPNMTTPNKMCKECLTGKQHREAFPKKSSWRASQKLQLVHSDICGPITPESTSLKRYIITFVNYYSRKFWTYFLNEKSQAFDTFKRFKAAVEKETGLMLQCLRTDRGGEFNSNEFKEFCEV